jgi:ankyrin repeat protein
LRLIVTLAMAGFTAFAALPSGARADAARDDNLDFAVAFGDVDKAQAALAAGADPNAVDEHGSPMLVNAARRSPEVVQLLLAYHAQVDQRDSKGGTALLNCALYSGTGLYDAKAVATLLIAAGADVNARTKDGLTPLGASLAVDQTNSQGLQDLLRAHGANQ